MNFVLDLLLLHSNGLALHKNINSTFEKQIIFYARYVLNKT